MADDKVMTQEELDLRVKKIVEDEMARGSSDSKIKGAVADAFTEFFAKNNLAAQVASVQMGAERKAAEAKAEPFHRTLAKIMIDGADRAMGEKPRFGTDLDMLKERGAEHLKRTGQYTTTTAGGYLIPTEEQLDPVMLIGAESPLIAKCNRIPMQTGNMTITTGATAITVSWVPEVTNTSSMASQATGLKPETQFAFGRVTLTRHMAVAMIKVTRQELNYSLGYMERFLRNFVPAKVQAALDTAILSGTATAASDPVTGLDTAISTNVITFNVADPFAAILDCINAPEEQLPGAAETDLCVTNSRALKYLRKVKDNDGMPILGRPFDPSQGRQFVDLYGYPVLKDSNVLATYGGDGLQSRFYAGDFARHAHVGMDSSLFVLVDPYSDSANNLVRFIFEIPFGFVVSSEKAFAYVDIPRT